MTDLATALVDRIERLQSPSPAVLVRTVYGALVEAGVDVAKLAVDTHAAIAREVEDRAEADAARKRTLEARVASGKLAPAMAAEAAERIKTLDARIKEGRRRISAELRRMEARIAALPPSAPTREMIAQAGDAPLVRDREPDGTPLSAPRYEWPWPVDRMQVSLSAEEYGAATRLRRAYLEHQPTTATTNYNGGSRGGGVREPVSERQMAAGRDWRAVWLRIDPPLRLIVDCFIVERAPKGHKRPLTAEEFGREYGTTRDARRALGAATGALKTTCAVIARLYREYDEWRADQAREQRRVASAAGRTGWRDQ